jgi:hypothetical protein
MADVNLVITVETRNVLDELNDCKRELVRMTLLRDLALVGIGVLAIILLAVI